MNDALYKKVRKIGFSPGHVAEVGVYLPETSNILLFIEDGCRADLFEADPVCVQKIRERFAGCHNLQIHPYAIYFERTTLGLYRTHASTFVRDLPSSPALVNDKYEPQEEDLFYVEARLFSDFDDGTIDLLSIDVEGCEWYVIQHMVSRPVVISLETHGKRYKNPFLTEIQQWMKANNYRIWYKEKSDTVFIKNHIKTGLFARWKS